MNAPDRLRKQARGLIGRARSLFARGERLADDAASLREIADHIENNRTRGISTTLRPYGKETSAT